MKYLKHNITRPASIIGVPKPVPMPVPAPIIASVSAPLPDKKTDTNSFSSTKIKIELDSDNTSATKKVIETKSKSEPLNDCYVKSEIEETNKPKDRSKSLSAVLPKPVSAPLSLPKPVKAAAPSSSLSKVTPNQGPPMAIVRPGVHARLSIDPSSQFPSISINTAVPPPCLNQPPPFIPSVPPPVIPNVYRPSPNIHNPPGTFPVVPDKQKLTSLVKKPEEEKIEIPKPELFLNKDQSYQNFFDKNKDYIFIGLEYIVEIEVSGNPTNIYSCRLCNSMFNEKGEQSSIEKLRYHLLTFSHRCKYMKKHFPTISEHKLKGNTPETTITKIAKTVEWIYGRMKARVVSSKAHFKSNLFDIDAAINQGEHFVECQEIVDIVLKNHPLPEKRASLFGASYRTISDKTEENVSTIKSDIIKKESAAEIPGENADTSSNTATKSEINEDGLGNKDSNTVKSEQVAIKKENQEDLDALSDISLEDIPKQNKLDDNIDVDKKNTENKRVETDEFQNLSREERHLKYKMERKERYETFIAEVDAMNSAMDKAKEDLIENPTEHPDYSKEWAIFYKTKAKDLEMKGLGVKQAWIMHWSTYFETEYSKRRQAARTRLMRKHKLLQRDIEEFASDGKKDENPTVETDLSPISDKEDDIEEKSIEQIERKRYSPLRRSASPWEEEEFGGKLKNKSNTSTPVKDEWSPIGGLYGKRLPDMTDKNTYNSPKAREVSPFSGRMHQVYRSPSSLRNNDSFCNPSASSPSPQSQKRKLSPFSEREAKLGRISSPPRDTEEDKRSNISGSNEINVLATLRLMSAIDQAGFISEFSRSIDEQLAIAIGKENQEQGSSNSMIDTKDCFKLFTLTRKKVQSLLRDPNITLKESEIRVLRIILDNLIIFFQRTSLTEEDIAEKPATKPGANPQQPDDKTIKLAVAQAIHKHLSSQGKTVSDTEFKQLVEAEFSRIKNQMAIDGQKLSATSQPASSQSQSLNPSRKSASPLRNLSRPSGSATSIPTMPYQSNMNTSRLSPGAMNPSRPFPTAQNPLRPSPEATGAWYGDRRSNSPMAGPSHASSHYPAQGYISGVPGASRHDSGLSGPVPGPSRPAYNPGIPEPEEEMEEDDFIEFTDEELISLLTNFKTLEPLEQKDLIQHMKKLEKKNPDRVKRLKEAMHKK